MYTKSVIKWHGYIRVCSTSMVNYDPFRSVYKIQTNACTLNPVKEIIKYLQNICRTTLYVLFVDRQKQMDNCQSRLTSSIPW